MSKTIVSIDLVEGFLVKVSIYGSVEYWLIKGYRHPYPEGFVAVPYRRFRQRLDVTSFKRLSPQSLLRRVDCVGWEAPLIPYSRILEVVDPSRVLSQRMKSLPRPALELLTEHVIPYSEWVGLTGSWAVFEEGPGSDIDILFYGDYEALYAHLRELASKGLISECKWENKLLDACYKAMGYTIKVLRALTHEPCSQHINLIGWIKAVIKIIDDSERVLTPAIYKAAVEKVLDASMLRSFSLENEVVLIETWRNRYYELNRGLYEVSGHVFYDQGLGAVLVRPDIEGYIKPSREAHPRNYNYN